MIEKLLYFLRFISTFFSTAYCYSKKVSIINNLIISALLCNKNRDLLAFVEFRLFLPRALAHWTDSFALTRKNSRYQNRSKSRSFLVCIFLHLVYDVFVNLFKGTRKCREADSTAKLNTPQTYFDLFQKRDRQHFAVFSFRVFPFQ